MAVLTRANTNTVLNLASSWLVGGVTSPSAPTSADTLIWAGTTYPATAIGAGGLSASGIQITNAQTSAVTIAATTGAVFRIGSGGINLSTSAINPTISAVTALDASQTWTVSAGKMLTVSGALSSSAPVTLTAAVAGTSTSKGSITISSAVTGSINLLKTGVGTLSLSSTTATHTYVGNITVQDGLFEVSSQTGAGAINNNIIVTGGTFATKTTQLLNSYNFRIQSPIITTPALKLSGSAIANTLAGGSTITLTGDSRVSLGNFTLNAPIDLAGYNVQIYSELLSNFGSTVTGQGSLEFVLGAGNLQLTSLVYDRQISVSADSTTSGSLALTGSTVLPNNVSFLTTGTNTVSLSSAVDVTFGAPLRVSANTGILGTASLYKITFSGPIIVDSGKTLTLQRTRVTTPITGSGSILGGVGMDLAADNPNFSGGITTTGSGAVNVYLSSEFAAGTGPFELHSTGVLNLTVPTRAVVRGLKGVTGANVAMAAKTLVISPDSNYTYAGVLTNGAVVLDGPGSQTLSGTNTYSISTELKQGTLKATVAASLGANTSANRIIFSGGTLWYDGSNVTDYSPRIESSGAPVRVNVSNSASTVSFASLSSSNNTSGFVKQGPGTLAFSGTSSIGGNVTVEAGVFQTPSTSLLSTSRVEIVTGGELKGVAGNPVNSAPIFTVTSFKMSGGSLRVA